MATTKKYIVGFLDIVDDVPEKAVFLHSKSVDWDKIETQPEDLPRLKRAVGCGYAQYMHFFEVDNNDFEDLKTEGFFKLNLLERIKKFSTKHKLQTA